MSTRRNATTAVAVLLVTVLFGTAFAGPTKHFPPFKTGLATNESWSSCTASLCIDAPPQGPQGLDGSGGWGWDNQANEPVLSLPVGKAATFTVTMLQPGSLPFCNDGVTGSIILTYSSQDFNLSPSSGRGVVFTNPFDRGGVATFAYSGDFFCHTDQSDSFTFTPLNPTNTALVTVTIIVDGTGQQASETFPVAIVKKR
jgi:hypothetical protein